MATSSSIRLTRGGHDVRFAEQLRVDLALRQFSLELTGFTTGAGLERAASVSVVVVPRRGTDDFESFLNWMDAAVAAGAAPLLIVPEAADLPPRVLAASGGVVFRHALSYDEVFEELFRTVTGVLPPWLDVRVRPSLIQSPTGVAWWSNDLYVADDRFEHAVRISPNDSTVVLPGLDDPFHLSLDRRRLIVANTSADEVLRCEIVDNMATEIQTIQSVSDLELAGPRDVRLSPRLSVIADTGHDRVLYRQARGGWRAVELDRPLASPGAVCLDDTGFWIADTGNGRVVRCDSTGRELLSHEGFALPVGILRWRNLLFVANEGDGRVAVLRVDDGAAGGLTELSPGIPLAGEFIGQPLGLSVSRNNRLAVSDRRLNCVWLVDLVAYGLPSTAFSEISSESRLLRSTWIASDEKAPRS